MARITLIALLLTLLSAPAWPGSDPAKSHFKLGQKAERQGRMVDALMHYNHARSEDPGNERYARAAARIRRRAAGEAGKSGNLELARQLDPASAPTDIEAALAAFEEPEPPRVATGLPSIDLLRGPVGLYPDNIRVDLSLKGSVKEVYEEVAKAFGLRAIVDHAYSADDQIRLNLDHVSFRTAINALGDVSGAFVVPVSEKLFLVAEDTTSKRQQLEPVVTATVPIPEAMNSEQAQEVSQAVQQALDLKRSLLTASRSQVAVRDSTAKVRMAQALYSQLAHAPGEAVIEFALLSMDRSKRTTLGVTPPTGFPVTNFSTVFNAQAPELDDEAAESLITVGGGDTIFGITVGSANVEATLDRGESRLVQSFQVRASNGKPAELKIGERFPIVNARYSTAAPVDDDGDNGGFVQPIPSFTFEDLGLVVTVTPTVHSANEVTLLIETEFRLLAGGAYNSVPIIANRSFQTQVRLKEGEEALVSGMATSTQSKARSGLAGLARIPLLGRLFRRHTVDVTQRDLILSIRPRIVRLPPGEMAPNLTIRFGPEERPLPAL